MEEVLDFIKNIIKPYKYTSIEDVETADIENQIEKYSKMSIIASNNIFMNLMMFQVDFLKEGCIFLRSKYDKYTCSSIPANISDTKIETNSDETTESETSNNEQQEDNVNDEKDDSQEPFESIEKPLNLKKEE